MTATTLSIPRFAPSLSQQLVIILNVLRIVPLPNLGKSNLRRVLRSRLAVAGGEQRERVACEDEPAGGRERLRPRPNNLHLECFYRSVASLLACQGQVLTEDQKRLMIERVHANETGIQNKTYKYRRCLRLYRTPSSDAT